MPFKKYPADKPFPAEPLILSRRRALLGLALAPLFATGAEAARPDSPIALREVARSPRFLCNAVAVTSHNAMFLGLPRWQGMDATPSLVRVAPDGSLVPFPGGRWNGWRPGDDPRDALVMVNGIHIFADDTLWVVDQGTADRKTVMPGAQKLVQFDTHTGRALQVLRFGSDILPPGAQLNDLRISGNTLYATDSGLGAIIVHDLRTGRTMRRLSKATATTQTPGRPLRAFGGRPLEDASGKRPAVQVDMLEVSADGRWLYFCTPTGPLRRIPTTALRDPALSEPALAAKVRLVADIPTIMGTTIDTAGNLYITDAEHRRVVILTPTGERVTLIEDDRLVDGDAMFIGADRQLYIPCAQTERLAMFARGRVALQQPWRILALPLPRSVAGHRLGSAVTH